MKVLEKVAIVAYLNAVIKESLAALDDRQASKIQDLIDESEYPMLVMMDMIGILPDMEKILPNASAIKSVNFAKGVLVNHKDIEIPIADWVSESARRSLQGEDGEFQPMQEEKETPAKLSPKDKVEQFMKQADASPTRVVKPTGSRGK